MTGMVSDNELADVNDAGLRPSWDAGRYDNGFGFVSRYGEALLELLAAQPGERVLDLGCGTGHHAAALARAGCEVIGVDADAGMLERAAALHADVLTERAGAATPAPGRLGLVHAVGAALTPELLGGPVSAVLSNAALHWMTDQAPVLAAVRSVLPPGGRFVAEMGGQDNIAAGMTALTIGVSSTTGVPRREVERLLNARSYFPSTGQQASLLERCRFAVEMITWFPRLTELSDGQTLSQWCQVFRPDVLALAGPPGSSAYRATCAAVDAAADEGGLRQTGPQGDVWVVDYVRLRFVARAR